MFSNYTIKARLLILVGFMSAILLLIAIVGWYGNHLATQGQREIYEGGTEGVIPLFKVSQAINDAINDIHNVSSQTWSFDQGERALREKEAIIKHNWDHYKTLISNAQSHQVDNQVHIQLQQVEDSYRQLHRLYANGERDQLLPFLKQELNVTYIPAMQQIDQLIQAYADQTTIDYKEAIASSEAFSIFMILTAIIGILLSLIFAWILIKSVSEALNYAISVVNKIASGNTEVRIERNSEDEIGQLLSAMDHMIHSSNSMVGVIEKVAAGDLSTNITPRSDKDSLGIAMRGMFSNLNQMINTLEKVAAGDLTVNVTPRSDKDSLGIAMREMLHNLRHMISKVQTEAAIVANSSQEIVASVTQVSANTAETASAVTETTTTTEELKQTAHIASEKAQGVLDNAEETLKIVKSSEQSLDSTITDMHQIQEKMRIISDSIIKLSEHNLAIGEIIDTVNDLAEQSNLLAVNAAIEAARAGEQGKSFGVVASEIRNLAEQSKNATIQVKSILNDVQNDTSAAVMATEQGSKAVAKGVNQSAKTAQAIINLSNSIHSVAQAARQIAISSQQQLVGVEQVTVAMSNINEASNRHAKHMKEIETEVISLSSVGGNLRELAEQYKMNHAAPVA